MSKKIQIFALLSILLLMPRPIDANRALVRGLATEVAVLYLVSVATVSVFTRKLGGYELYSGLGGLFLVPASIITLVQVKYSLGL